MPAIHPPLNAVALLRGKQLAELARIPLDNRRVAAWLILLRDDDTCLWRERDLPCTACRGRWPCIDSNARSSGLIGRCQNCHYANLPCTRDGADEATGPGDAQAYGHNSIHRVASMRSVSAPVAYFSARAGFATIAESEELVSSESSSTRRRVDTLPAKPAFTPPLSPPAPLTSRPLRSAPPTLQRAATRPRIDAAAGGGPSTPSLHANGGFVPRPVLMRLGARAVSTPVPARPPLHDSAPYDFAKVRSILRKVKHRYDVLFCQGNPGMSLRLTPLSKHVKVLSPGHPGGSWAVLVFTAELGVIYHSELSKAARERALTINGPGFWYDISYAELFGEDGGVHAATIALWFLNKNRLRYPTHFVIDVTKARKEHALILQDKRPEWEAMRTTAPTTAFERRPV